MHFVFLFYLNLAVSTSLEVFRLQGPWNTSVEAGKTARLKCSLLFARSTGGGSRHRPERIDFVQWRLAPTQKISVQWNIDGFGYTLETMLDSFGGRYTMPGPTNEGIFDLVVQNVGARDLVTFTCQATLQTFLLLEPPRVKTMTSETVSLFIYSPPDRLELSQLDDVNNNNSHSVSAILNSNPDILQADIPSQSDPYNLSKDRHRILPSFQKSAPITSTSSLQPTIFRNHNEDDGDTSSHVHIAKRGDEIWAAERDSVRLQCRASQSRPTSRLMWILAQTEENVGAPPPMFEFSQVREKTASGPRGYPKWRYVFDFREQDTYGFFLENKEMPAASIEKGVTGLSTLTLTMDQSVSGRRLECLVQNAADFQQSVMPKISTVLQVVYIKNLTIQHNASQRNPVIYKQNETVKFTCAADANPKKTRFLWTLTEPVSTGVGRFTRHSKHPQTTSRSSRQLNLDPREREISTTASISLRISPSHHRQLLRCWIGAAVSKADSNEIIQVWREVSTILRVQYGPELQGPQQEATAVSLGQTAHLTCHVEANPPGQVTWYRYGGIHIVNEATIDQNPNTSRLFTPTVISSQLVRSFIGADLTDSEFEKIMSDQRYLLLSVTAHSIEDFGIYICIGTAVQRTVRKIFILAEAGPPRIESPDRAVGALGGGSRLVCQVFGLPKPGPQDIIWYSPDNQVLQPSSSAYIEYEEMINGATTTLVFTHITTDLFGVYNCSVSTNHGRDSHLIALKETKEIPHAFAIGVGIATVISVIFAGVILWALRRQITHNREHKTARIVTVDSKSQNDLYSGQATWDRNSTYTGSIRRNISTLTSPIDGETIFSINNLEGCQLISSLPGTEFEILNGSPIFARVGVPQIPTNDMTATAIYFTSSPPMKNMGNDCENPESQFAVLTANIEQCNQHPIQLFPT